MIEAAGPALEGIQYLHGLVGHWLLKQTPSDKLLQQDASRLGPRSQGSPAAHTGHDAIQHRRFLGAAREQHHNTTRLRPLIGPTVRRLIDSHLDVAARARNEDEGQ